MKFSDPIIIKLHQMNNYLVMALQDINGLLKESNAWDKERSIVIPQGVRLLHNNESSVLRLNNVILTFQNDKRELLQFENKFNILNFNFSSFDYNETQTPLNLKTINSPSVVNMDSFNKLSSLIKQRKQQNILS